MTRQLQLLALMDRWGTRRHQRLIKKITGSKQEGRHMRMEHRVRSRPSSRLGAVSERVVESIVDIPSPAVRGMSMDINTAPVLRLKSLSGIGGHYAKKIVEGRPYRNSEELLTRHILPQYIYGRIMDRLVVGQS